MENNRNETDKEKQTREVLDRLFQPSVIRTCRAQRMALEYLVESVSIRKLMKAVNFAVKYHRKGD